MLEKSRTEKGLEISKIAQIINVRKLYLLALENGKFDDIPGKTYVKGYLKLYSNFLGIEEEIAQIQTISTIKITKFTKAKERINDNRFIGSIFALLFIIVIVTMINKSINSKTQNGVMDCLIHGIDE